MANSVFGKNNGGSNVKELCADASPHVIVVDDNPIDRIVVSHILTRSNIRVTVLEDPKKAWDLLNSDIDVSMIITDYCMPEMTGYDLLMAVKGSSKLHHIPVVVVSADNYPDRIKKCLDAGAKDYILKPIKLADVGRICSHLP